MSNGEPLLSPEKQGGNTFIDSGGTVVNEGSVGGNWKLGL